MDVEFQLHHFSINNIFAFTLPGWSVAFMSLNNKKDRCSIIFAFGHTCRESVLKVHVGTVSSTTWLHTSN